MGAYWFQTTTILGAEIFGRWSGQCVRLEPELARERSRGIHLRLRRGVAYSLQHRWWGLLGIGLQKAAAHLILNAPAGADLVQTQLEPTPPIADVAF